MSKWEINLTCPKCGKRKRYENKRKGVYYCFVCASGGKLAEETMGSQELVSPDIPAEGMEPPPEHRKLTEFDLRYFTKRGISSRLLNLHENSIRSTEQGILFIFPTEDYWQERRWNAFRPPPWRFPRNSPRTTKDGITYHLRIVPSKQNCVVVEGVFDALKCASAGYNAAAVLSKKVHDNQAIELSRYYSSCILILDSDVSLADFNSAVNVLSQHMDVEGIILSEGDPADQSIETLKELIE